jgi:hypothetical protein
LSVTPKHHFHRHLRTIFCPREARNIPENLGKPAAVRFQPLPARLSTYRLGHLISVHSISASLGIPGTRIGRLEKKEKRKSVDRLGIKATTGVR